MTIGGARAFIIIPLCSNELRILNPYRGCSIGAIPARFDSARMFLGYPVRFPELEVEERHRKSSARTVLLARFCLLSRIFAVFSRK